MKATPIIELFNNRSKGFVNASVKVEYAYKGYELNVGDIITFNSGYRFFVVSKSDDIFVISMLYNTKTREEFLLERKLKSILCEGFVSGNIENKK